MSNPPILGQTLTSMRPSSSWGQMTNWSVTNTLSSTITVPAPGDNLTGYGEGDDEAVIFDLRKIPAEVQKAVITVTIHEAEQRKQNFGQVSNAFVRLVNVQTKEELIRYDLAEDYSVETSMIMAELYRQDGGWRMNAVGSGYEGGLQALLDRYQ